MIVVGYQGIGKSTLANGNDRYVDLESGCFWHNSERPTNWFIYYCNIAEHLSKQGYVVFVSSHAEVRSRLKKYCKEAVLAVVPSVQLKQEWIEKLYIRAYKSGLQKDWKAYYNAVDRFEENINEIKQDLPFKEITTMDYDLEQIIGNI